MIDFTSFGKLIPDSVQLHYSLTTASVQLRYSLNSYRSLYPQEYDHEEVLAALEESCAEAKDAPARSQARSPLSLDEYDEDGGAAPELPLKKPPSLQKKNRVKEDDHVDIKLNELLMDAMGGNKKKRKSRRAWTQNK